MIVATSERAAAEPRLLLSHMGCDVITFPGSGRVPIRPLLQELGRRGMTNILVEGGGRVLGSFWDEGEVDAVDVFIASIIEGGDHAQTAAHGRGISLMHAAARLQGVEISTVGGDIRVRGWLPQPWRKPRV